MVLLSQEKPMYFHLPCVQHQQGRTMSFGDAPGEIQQDGETSTTEVGKPQTGLLLKAVCAPHCSTEFRSLHKSTNKQTNN